MAFASAGAGRETNQRTGDRSGVENLGENAGEGVGVSARQERSDKIKRAAGGAGRRQGHERQVESENDMSPTNAANWGLKQGFGTL